MGLGGSFFLLTHVHASAHSKQPLSFEEMLLLFLIGKNTLELAQGIGCIYLCVSLCFIAGLFTCVCWALV